MRPAVALSGPPVRRGRQGIPGTPDHTRHAPPRGTGYPHPHAGPPTPTRDPGRHHDGSPDGRRVFRRDGPPVRPGELFQQLTGM